MILLLHIAFLLYTTYKVSFFVRKGRTYRPFISFIAYLWGAGSAVLAVAMIWNYPEAIDRTNAITLFLTGAFAGAAWWSGGNVSELLRKITRNRFA